MDINYFLNAMLEKIDWAILNTYLINDKNKKKSKCRCIKQK